MNSITELNKKEIKEISGGDVILAIGTVLAIIGFYFYGGYRARNIIKPKGN